jgi:hypothetical protein
VPPEAALDEAEAETWDLTAAPAPFEPSRFDEPSASQLESRGLTSQPSDSHHITQHPQTQAEFWSSQTAWKNTIAAKLTQAGRPDLAAPLEQCHTVFTHAFCFSCGKHSIFPNRCDLFYCPECQPRLAAERRGAIDWWINEVKAPKHVTLTLSNQPTLNAAWLHDIKAFLTRLRRRKFCRNWRGGCWSLEITNSGHGWHPHLHLLVDAPYIDPGQLAREWNSVTDSQGHIVKVKGCRGEDYLAEVAKYVVKGSTLASWAANDIVAFIQSVRGQRTFGVFGSLYGRRADFQAWLDQVRNSRPTCDCPEPNVKFFTEADWIIFMEIGHPPPARPPPPVSDPGLPGLSDWQKLQSHLAALRR